MAIKSKRWITKLCKNSVICNSVQTFLKKDLLIQKVLKKFVFHDMILVQSEAYLEPSQTSMRDLFCLIVNGF